MNDRIVKFIACATVIEEMKPLLPPGSETEILDFGLHTSPEKLKKTLQRAIDESCGHFNTIVLGYGLCSNAVVGLKAGSCKLVIPRVDDCIAIFLGSTDAYRAQAAKAAGTYYMTKGWIEVNDTPFAEHERLVEQYGKEKADRVMALMLKHYTRIAYIDTGVENQETYRTYARKVASTFNLRYEEIEGSNSLLKKMITGPWGDDFIVVGPGETIRFEDFRK